MAEPIVLDGASIHAVALITVGEPPEYPKVEIRATDATGQPVRLLIVGGAGAAAPCARLAAASRRLWEASEQVEQRRLRAIAASHRPDGDVA